MKIEKIELAGLRFESNRSYGGEGEIKILAEDIKRNGLINPITVLETAEDDGAGDITVYEVIAGRRRVLAVTSLGWKEIPCRILEGDEVEHAEEIAGSENINRMAMHPLDEALIFSKLLENGRPIEELAKQYDRSISAIWQRVQLLSLNDGIKELFRDGKISLHAAAMLKSLDDAQQAAFYEKHHKQRDIGVWDVNSFISKVRHDKLYKCMVGKECSRCDKRTYFSNKALFPELNSGNDLCLDHDCYMGKWLAALVKHIKDLKERFKTHAEANIIVFDDDGLAKIFGKKVNVGGTDFAVVKTTWEQKVNDKPNKKSKPCFHISIENGTDDEGDETSTQIINCSPMFWNEPAKKKSQNATEQRQNPFVPIIKFLGLNEEEEKQTLDAFMGKLDPKKEPWEVQSKASDIERKVKEKIFDRLMDMVSAKPDDEKNIDRFLTYFFGNESKKRTIKKFAGSEKITDIKKLSNAKMFALLYASTLSTWQLPDFGKFTPGLKNSIAEWVGIPIDKLKEMYMEELKPLVPKPAVEKVKPSKSKKTKADK